MMGRRQTGLCTALATCLHVSVGLVRALHKFFIFSHSNPSRCVTLGSCAGGPSRRPDAPARRICHIPLKRDDAWRRKPEPRIDSACADQTYPPLFKSIPMFIASADFRWLLDEVRLDAVRSCLAEPLQSKTRTAKSAPKSTFDLRSLGNTTVTFGGKARILGRDAGDTPARNLLDWLGRKRRSPPSSEQDQAL